MSIEHPDQQPSPPLYPPEVRGRVANMEELMQTPELNTGTTPTQLAIELMREGTIKTFDHFEACLRDVGSRVHFLARPRDFSDNQYTTVYPLGREGEPQYTLYVAVNGPEEASQLLQILGTTPEQNQARLKYTGVLARRRI